MAGRCWVAVDRAEQPAGDPTDLRQRGTVLARPHLGNEPTGYAERQPDEGKGDDQEEVVAGGGERVQVLGVDEEHEQERNDHAPTVELPLLGLAENEKHERGVEEVL